LAPLKHRFREWDCRLIPAEGLFDNDLAVTVVTTLTTFRLVFVCDKAHLSPARTVSLTMSGNHENKFRIFGKNSDTLRRSSPICQVGWDTDRNLSFRYSSRRNLKLLLPQSKEPSSPYAFLPSLTQLPVHFGGKARAPEGFSRHDFHACPNDWCLSMDCLVEQRYSRTKRVELCRGCSSTRDSRSPSVLPAKRLAHGAGRVLGGFRRDSVFTEDDFSFKSWDTWRHALKNSILGSAHGGGGGPLRG